MSEQFSILGLIPARGGSKGIPHKNIVPLAGKPLLAYTCQAAFDCRLINRVLLSTDDEAIAAVGREYGVEVPFMRPPELALDTTPSLPVIQHALDWLMEHESWQPDIVTLLQPTSPLRQARHLDEALSRMIETGADTVVSVVAVPHHFSPYKVMQVEDGWLKNFWQQPLPFDPLRRQNVPTLYARNGPAILATRTNVLLNRQSLYGERVLPYVMNEIDSIDVDTAFDLQLAAWALSTI